MVATPARQTYGTYEVVRTLGSRPASGGLAQRGARVSSFLARRVGDVDGSLMQLHVIEGEELAETRRRIERYRELVTESGPALEVVLECAEHEGALLVVQKARQDGVRLDRLKSYLDRDRERLPDPAIWFLAWRLFGALVEAHLTRDDTGALDPLVHGSLNLFDVVVSWDGEVRVQGMCPGIGPPLGENDQPRPVDDAWLAPEVRRGDAPTPSADTFSGAMVLRSLLTGRAPPAVGSAVEPLVEIRSDLPRDVAEILDRAIMRGPDDAAPSAADLMHRFEGLVRLTDGRRALCECMELYQALWGLWSVAAPAVWEDMADSVPAPPVAAVPLVASMKILDELTNEVAAEVAELSEESVAPPAAEEVLEPTDDEVLLLDETQGSIPDDLAIESTPEPESIPVTEPEPELIDEPEPESDPDADYDEPILPRPMTSLVDDDDSEDNFSDVTQPDIDLFRLARSPSGLLGASDVLRRAHDELGAAHRPSSPLVQVIGHFEVNGDPSDEASEEAIAEDALDEPMPGAAGPALLAALAARQGASPRPRGQRRRARSAPIEQPALPATKPEDEGGVATRWGVFLAVATCVGIAAWYGARPATPVAPDDGAAPQPSTSTSAARPAVEPAANRPEPATPEPATPDPPEPEPDGEPLKSYEAYLIVRSPVDAEVWVKGQPVGDTNAKNRVRCGMKHVRLRQKSPGPTKSPWLTAGEPVQVNCLETREVTIAPEVASP